MMLGRKWGFIQTTIEYALQRPELRYGLLTYLSELMEKELIEAERLLTTSKDPYIR